MEVYKVSLDDSYAPAGYSHPPDPARFVQDHWGDVPNFGVGDNFSPDAATLLHFLSGCYHASMLREEERPVTFRAIIEQE